MRLAITDLFRARWTDQIHEEWIRSVLEDRPDLTREQLERTRLLMNSHVRDSVVSGYEDLIDGLQLPDPDDRHDDRDFGRSRHERLGKLDQPLHHGRAERRERSAHRERSGEGGGQIARRGTKMLDRNAKRDPECERRPHAAVGIGGGIVSD